MKKLLLSLAIFFFVGLVAQAQPELKFTATTHDFGVITEKGGKVKHRFEFTNTGDEPLVISNVQASCGCTTPEWTKTPVPPKGKGYVDAQYDPLNRPGSFNKSLTINSNAFPSTATLFIKGEVKQ